MSEYNPSAALPQPCRSPCNSPLQPRRNPLTAHSLTACSTATARPQLVSSLQPNSQPTHSPLAHSLQPNCSLHFARHRHGSKVPTNTTSNPHTQVATINLICSTHFSMCSTQPTTQPTTHLAQFAPQNYTHPTTSTHTKRCSVSNLKTKALLV